MPFEHEVVCMHRSAYDSNRMFIGLRYGGIVSIYYNYKNDTWTNEGNVQVLTNIFIASMKVKMVVYG